MDPPRSRPGSRASDLVGLPGPSDPVKLLGLSRRIGLGESARFLRRHTSWIRRLTLPRGYSPADLLEQLGPHLAAPENRIAGIHVFTFNELPQVQAWRLKELQRLGTPVPGM